MYEVLDVLFGGDPWENMIRGLGLAVDVRVMMQHRDLSLFDEREDT